MALPAPKYIEHVYKENKAIVDFTLQEISHYTDSPFKRIDSWIKEGLLPNYGITTKGSGHNRIFSYDAAFMLALLASIGNLGLGTQRLRTVAKVVYPIIENPFGVIMIDLDNPENTKYAKSGTSDIAAILREHLRYGPATPTMVIDVDKIHLDIDNWLYDCKFRRELQLATEILGREAKAADLSRMVEVIEDMEEYLKGKKKPVNSRFR
jgi:hypothetical protein